MWAEQLPTLNHLLYRLLLLAFCGKLQYRYIQSFLMEI